MHISIYVYVNFYIVYHETLQPRLNGLQSTKRTFLKFLGLGLKYSQNYLIPKSTNFDALMISEIRLHLGLRVCLGFTSGSILTCLKSPLKSLVF